MRRFTEPLDVNGLAAKCDVIGEVQLAISGYGTSGQYFTNQQGKDDNGDVPPYLASGNTASNGCYHLRETISMPEMNELTCPTIIFPRKQHEVALIGISLDYEWNATTGDLPDYQSTLLKFTGQYRR